ncbi:MAG: tail fiber domain-containing protein [Verrucomicrobia bacterium]|nr:tail fiber domain-containing protein [Verrucomicrobiota bacterium]
MKQTTKLLGMLAGAAFALGQAALTRAADANPPERVTYQGYLVDGNGSPLGNSAPTNYDVIFRIYDAKSGGTKLWSEQQTITVDKGYFSVLLGEGSSYSNELRGSLSVVFDGATASDRFIGITVSGLGGGDVEIAPRLRLVTSPYAYTATQARRLSDGSGNANFYKDGTSLKLGAGATPTLTLPEAGGASLTGSLNLILPTWGWAIDITTGTSKSYIGDPNGNGFQILTESPNIYLNKELQVNGNIRSYNSDTIIGPTNNTDTYLKIHSGSDDIHAYADNFYVRGAADLKVEVEAASVDFRTTAPAFLMNKPLTVEGETYVQGRFWAKQPGRPGVMIGGGGGSDNVVEGYNASGGYSSLYLNYYGGGKVFARGDLDVSGTTTANSPVVVKGSGRPGVYIGTHGSTLTDNIIEGIGSSSQLASLHLNYYSPEPVYVGYNGGASMRVYGRSSTLGYSSWPLSLYVGDSDSDTLGVIAGPGRIAMGFHGPNRKIYFIDEQEDHYTATLSEGGTWWTNSDINLKKDIKDLGNVLDKLELIRGVKYKYVYNKSNETHIGVIAQEVEKHFPELVEAMMEGDGLNDDQEESHLGVTYDGFAPVLIEAVKELRSEKNEQLAEKDQRINELEARLAKLEAMMARMKDEG